MKPFYDEGGITIFHGDCTVVLPALRMEGIPYVDMLLVDPPYGETELEWDEQTLDGLLFGACLLKPVGSAWCFGSLRSFMAQASTIAAWWKIAQEVVWEKHNGSGFTKDRFRRVHEHILQLYSHGTAWADVYKDPQFTNDAIDIKVQTRRKKRSTHFGRIISEPYVSQDGGPRQQRSVIFARSCQGYAVHPTQKPVEVLAPLIRYSCPKGGVVLDPMMGSGSTLLAAQALGRRAIGIEKNEEDCRNAVMRLKGVDVKGAQKQLAQDPRQTKLF